MAQPWDYGKPSYALTRRITGQSFDMVVEKTRQALSEQGFGVLTEIDVKQTLKKKLDKDVSSYLILGACNPPLADQALGAEPGIGVLLPCNVVVVQEPDSVAVSAVDPESMFSVVNRDEVKPIAQDVKTRLQKVLEALD